MKTQIKSYISPKLEIRPHPLKGGFGVFACQKINTGEQLVRFGGQLLSGDDLMQLLLRFRSLSLQIEENLYLVSFEPDLADYVNHSCNPNGGMFNATTLVAMKTIARGEEVCFDYAMTDGSKYDEFDCCCGSTLCRRKITGEDWKLPELWFRYSGYFSPYLSQRIQKLSQSTVTIINQ